MQYIYNCPTIPPPEIFRKEYINRAKQELYHALTMNSKPLLCAYLEGIYFHDRSKVCSEILFDILSILDYNSHEDLKNNFLLILNIFPDAAKEKDNSGQLPLHKVLMTEDYDKELVIALVTCYPQSVSMYTETVYGQFTPLHLVLTKQEVDFSLAWLMLSACPFSARCDTSDGYFPLHLAIPISENIIEDDSAVMGFLRVCLSSYRDAAFVEITEEIRKMQLCTTVVDSNIPIIPHFIHTVQTITWNPLHRMLENASNEKLKKIFLKFRDGIAKRRIISQYRR